MEKVKEVINKVTHHKDAGAHDPTLAHDPNNTTGGGLTGSHAATGQNTTGLHSSNVGNTHSGQHIGKPTLGEKLNPTVDSDRDGKTNFGLAKEGPGAHNNHNHNSNTGTGVGAGTAGQYSDSYPTQHAGQHTGAHHNAQTNYTNTPAGKPSLADKVNPMVDSDRDGKTNFGLAKDSSGAHHNAQINYTNTPSGKPSLADKLNPMVDSDRDGKTNFGLAKEGSGVHNTYDTGVGAGAGTYGTNTQTTSHSGHLANEVDPRVGNSQSANTGIGGNSGYVGSDVGADPRNQQYSNTTGQY